MNSIVVADFLKQKGIEPSSVVCMHFPDGAEDGAKLNLNDLMVDFGINVLNEYLTQGQLRKKNWKPKENKYKNRILQGMEINDWIVNGWGQVKQITDKNMMDPMFPIVHSISRYATQEEIELNAKRTDITPY